MKPFCARKIVNKKSKTCKADAKIANVLSDRIEIPARPKAEQ